MIVNISNKINKLNAWLEKYNFDLAVINSPEAGFAYDFYMDCIFYNDDISIYPYLAQFLKFVEKLAGRILPYDPRTIAFMHELGHSQTWDDGNDIDYILDDLKNILNIGKCEWLNRIKNYIYIHLPIEKFATQWAVTYMLSNYTAIKELNDIITEEYDGNK